MDYESLLQKSRWQIVKTISEHPKSASEVAEAVETSLPNASQQLRLLEAYRIVSHDTARSGEVGKPKQVYRLAKAFALITFVREGFAERKTISPDKLQGLLLQLIFVQPQQDQGFLLKFFLMHEEIIEKCTIGILKSSGEEIEILLITEDVEPIRKNYSNTTVSLMGETRKIIAWTHSTAELNDGLAKEEAYFMKLMKNPFIIYDPQGRLDEVER